MDADAALTEWHDLINCIEPRSKFEEFRMRAQQHSRFDTDIPVELIEERTEFYQIDKHMYFTPPEGTRCRHVFASALKTDSKNSQLEYNLFRTYYCPKGSNVLEGSQNPHECKISHAFRATGAAKYFTLLWKEPIAGKGLPKCLNIHFPSPHNITELALNEMWGLYGKDVEISVITNIRPGIPNITQRIEVDQDLPSPTGGLEPVTRQPTFGLEGDARIEEKLRRDEVESNVKRKLRKVYPEHTPPFYWLVSAPERSAPGTAPKHYTKEYLRIPSVQAIIEEVGQRIGKGTSEIEDP